MKQDGEDKVPYIWLPFAFGAISLTLFFANFILLFKLYPDPVNVVNHGATDAAVLRGTFGDMFGATNAILSALSFAGIVFAVILQRHEITLAQKALRKTSEVVEQQKKQIEGELKNQGIAAFEARFFQMLIFLQNMINSADLRDRNSPSQTIASGKDIFVTILSDIKQKIKIECEEFLAHQDPYIAWKSPYNKAYSEFYSYRRKDLSHYFRLIESILFYIDKSSVENKKFYTDLVSVQMTDGEIGNLFYFCISNKCSTSFKKMIEKYSVLSGLNENDVELKFLIKDYDKNAFLR